MQSVQLVIDGRPVRVPTGTTIWQAAERVGIEIPTLCHQPHVTPVGVCRLCVVDVGERVLAASCVRACEAGMEVQTESATVRGHRGALLELLLREHPLPCERERTTGDCELEALGRAGGILPERPSGSTGSVGSVPVWRGPALETVRRPTDVSSPVIAVDHQACILCDRCVRACDEVQSNEVIGRTGKGSSAQIAFDLNDPMGRSSCVACGECAASCPTGALTDRAVNLPLLPRSELRSVDSVCPYCGVGCAVTFYTTPGVPQPSRYHNSRYHNSRNTVPRRVVRIELESRSGNRFPAANCVCRRPRKPGQPWATLRQGTLRVGLRITPPAIDTTADSSGFPLPQGASLGRSCFIDPAAQP